VPAQRNAQPIERWELLFYGLCSRLHSWIERLFEGLEAFVLRADTAAVLAGATREVQGAPAVADTFKGRARAAQPALVNGAPGAVWAPGGQPRVVFGFTIMRSKIVAIDLLADPARLRQLDLVILGK
jgi:hypothetical protein